MKSEEKRNNQTMIIVTILCAALFGLAVAYAALSATLNVTFGSVGQTSLTWNVGFEPGSVTATKTGSTAAVCGEATVTASTVSVGNTVLATLHDKCVYALKIKNLGSVDAELTSVATKTPSGIACDSSVTSKMVCEDITYKLTTDSAGLSLLGLNNTLPSENGELDVYLTVEYAGTDGSRAQQSSGGFTLNYVQK